MARQLTTLFLTLGLCASIGASAQDSTNLATLKAREAESIVKLTSEGKTLYDNDRRSWGQICADSWLLAEQGRLREAIRMASKALFLGVSEGNHRAQAFAKRDLGLVYSYAGHLDRALEYSLQSVKHAHTSSGNWRKDDVLMVAHKVAGDVYLRRGEPSEAIREYEQALKYASSTWKLFTQVSLANANTAAKNFTQAKAIFDEIGSSVFSSRRQLIQRGRAHLALAQADAAEALKLFSEALSAASGSDAEYERVWALDGIGKAQLKLGNREEAIKAYLQAVDIAERVRAQFRNEEFKSGLFGDMRQVFDAATSLLAEVGDFEKAWEVSERGRGRALLDMVRNRVKLGTGVNAFVDTSASSPSAAELRQAIPNGTAVIQFHVLADRVYAWVIRKESVSFAHLATSRSALSRAIDRYRDVILDRRATSSDIGFELYRMLIYPLALRAGEALVIVPHDALHYLPFHALRDGDGYLIERFPLAYAPSASALRTLLGRPQMSTAASLLALGNPELGDPSLDLPAAQREVERLKSVFPSAAIFVRQDATKARIVDGAAESRILHIAAHAEVDSVDPLFSRIRLAIGGRGGADLEAREVYGLDLAKNAMVVLSACDSGLGKVSNGDEIWGFTRAFLGAGTSSLLVSLWPVADDSTEQLMAGFYSETAKAGDRRDALRQAQIDLIKNPKFREPFYWAPFTLVGDWR